jgi:RNA polymerase sigma factor (sigma-70 family)
MTTATKQPRSIEERNRLAAENVALVFWFIQRHVPDVTRFDEEDLAQELMFALLRAAERFDPARGAFSTFAVKCIGNGLRQERARAERHKARVLTDAYSIDAGSSALQPAAHDDADPAELIECEDEQVAARAAALAVLDLLPDDDAELLRMRFGLDEHEPHTLREIGEARGVTRERARQRIERALTGAREIVEA